MKNTLYYGDNLDVLRQYIADESVDLVYLDPPFKSDQDYNVLFAEQNGSAVGGADPGVRGHLAVGSGGRGRISGGRRSGRPGLAGHAGLPAAVGDNDMLAYLSMMAPRLVELRRVLKPTGSIYLHCDPTASHYLKMLMDAVFGPANFRNEIIWKRTQAHGLVQAILPEFTTRFSSMPKARTTIGTKLQSSHAYDPENTSTHEDVTADVSSQSADRDGSGMATADNRGDQPES